MMIQVLVLPFSSSSSSSSSSLSLCFVIKVVVVVGRLDYYMIDYLKNEIWCEDSGLPLIQNGRKYGPIKASTCGHSGTGFLVVIRGGPTFRLARYLILQQGVYTWYCYLDKGFASSRFSLFQNLHSSRGCL